MDLDLRNGYDTVEREGTRSLTNTMKVPTSHGVYGN